MIEGDNVAIPHVLWNFTLLPGLAEQLVRVLEEWALPASNYLGWDAVQAWCLVAGQAVDALTELIQGWQFVLLLHNGKRLNGLKRGV